MKLLYFLPQGVYKEKIYTYTKGSRKQFEKFMVTDPLVSAEDYGLPPVTISGNS